MNTLIKSFDQLTLKELYEIIKLRIDVFSIEQNCLYQDLDNLDFNATHFLLTEDDKLLSYLRIINIDKENNSARIGRVVSRIKSVGLGSVLMNQAINYLKNEHNIKTIKLSAQTIALNFYKRLGFKIVSNEYLLDNIPHYDMELYL